MFLKCYAITSSLYVRHVMNGGLVTGICIFTDLGFAPHMVEIEQVYDTKEWLLPHTPLLHDHLAKRTPVQVINRLHPFFC